MGVFSGEASAHWEWLWEAVGCDLGSMGGKRLAEKEKWEGGKQLRGGGESRPSSSSQGSRQRTHGRRKETSELVQDLCRVKKVGTEAWKSGLALKGDTWSPGQKSCSVAPPLFSEGLLRGFKDWGA